jgi:hypothetical protein
MTQLPPGKAHAKADEENSAADGDLLLLVGPIRRSASLPIGGGLHGKRSASLRRFSPFKKSVDLCYLGVIGLGAELILPQLEGIVSQPPAQVSILKQAQNSSCNRLGVGFHQ